MTYNVAFVYENKGRMRQLFKKASEAFWLDCISSDDLSYRHAPLKSFIEKGQLTEISLTKIGAVACHLKIENPFHVSRGDVLLLAPMTKSGFFGRGIGISRIEVTSDTDRSNSLLITRGGVIEALQAPRTMVADYPLSANDSLVQKLCSGMTAISHFMPRLKRYGRPSLLRRFL